MIEEVKDDQTLDYITPERDGGNILIARDKATGNLLILQISPELKITIDVEDEASANFGASSDSLLFPPDRFTDVKWTEVSDPITVEPTRISLTLKGELDGNPVSVSFVQASVDEPFLVTAQER